MRKTKYTVKYTTGFKKDYKRAIKRGLPPYGGTCTAVFLYGSKFRSRSRDLFYLGLKAGLSATLCLFLPSYRV